MALDTANVRVAVTGGAFVAPLATPLPTTAVATKNAAFLSGELGYLDESGIVQHIANDQTNIKAWQNSTTVRVIQSSFDVTYDLTMIEINPVTLAAYFGNYTALADGANFNVSAAALPHKSWVFDVVDDAVKIRLVVPDGQITVRGDTSLVNAVAIGLPVTIQAFPDTNNVNAYGYIDLNVATST